MADRAGSERIRSVAEHLDAVLATVAPLPPVEATLLGALGLVAAEDLRAEVAVPRFDHAAMDGYAVASADLASATPDRPLTLPIAGTVEAGAGAPLSLGPGSVLRIMTGAAIPVGADAVVPFERATATGTEAMTVSEPVEKGRNVRRTGEDVAPGELLVERGTRLTARHTGVLAAAGRHQVVVRPRPQVAVVSTGSELVPADLPLTGVAPDAVPDSNAVAIAAAARAAGATVRGIGPVPDDPERFATLVAGVASEADLVVTTGGVSAGDHDVVKAALAEVGTMWFGPVAVRPGRPQGVGTVRAVDGRDVPLVALPGTPAAAYLTFQLFVVPALRVLAGRAPRRSVRGRLAAEVQSVVGRTDLVPVTYDAGVVAPVPGRAGHSLRALSSATALLVVAEHDRLLSEDTEVQVIPLDAEET